jgi:pimeloyl-ACP methyl ester carboxylesterase
MGGYIAFAMMRQAPDRVELLALLDTSALSDTANGVERRKGNCLGPSRRISNRKFVGNRIKLRDRRQTFPCVFKRLMAFPCEDRREFFVLEEGKFWPLQGIK